MISIVRKPVRIIERSIFYDFEACNLKLLFPDGDSDQKEEAGEIIANCYLKVLYEAQIKGDDTTRAIIERTLEAVFPKITKIEYYLPRGFLANRKSR